MAKGHQGEEAAGWQCPAARDSAELSARSCRPGGGCPQLCLQLCPQLCPRREARLPESLMSLSSLLMERSLGRCRQPASPRSTPSCSDRRKWWAGCVWGASGAQAACSLLSRGDFRPAQVRKRSPAFCAGCWVLGSGLAHGWFPPSSPHV